MEYTTRRNISRNSIGKSILRFGEYAEIMEE